MGLDISLYASAMNPDEVNNQHNELGYRFDGLSDEITLWDNKLRKGIWELHAYLFSHHYSTLEDNGRYTHLRPDLDEMKELYIKELLVPNIFPTGLIHLAEIIEVLGKRDYEGEGLFLYHYSSY